MKIKILRNFSVESKVFVKGIEVEVENNFAGSSRYYEVISFDKSEPVDKEVKKTRPRKRVPKKSLDYRNVAILNKDKK